MKDLILLVSDKNMQFALRGGLRRPGALGIRKISFDFIVHPGRDGGVRRSGPELVALERRRFRHAVIMLDFEGSGTSHASPLDLERELDARLQSVWTSSAKAIVAMPEVDAWMWGADNALRQLVGWTRLTDIRAWLEGRAFEFGEDQKPIRPKEAFETLLRDCQRQRSSALYERITSKISLARCQDAAFIRLRSQLREWFGVADLTPET